jgi:DNA-binding NtrC family response regulator
LPPLRERQEDFKALFEHFVEKHNSKLGLRVRPVFRQDVENLFRSCSWPGNIREYESVIERAMILSKSSILEAGHFNFLLTNKAAESGISINIPDVVNNILDGATSWDTLKNIQGDSRKGILLALIERLTAKNGKRPTHKELAEILNVKENHMRQILRNVGIKLRSM